jgi:ABC-type bacteriocin/lantibiotic exporter with double-glycine peptidase domain
MKLRVLKIKQKNKVGCGAAAMSMLYKYFGKDISEEEIIKEVGGLTKWGSFVTDHAFMARKMGLKVICHSYNLEYFNPIYEEKPKKDFIKRIASLIRTEKRAYNKRELESIKRALESDIDFSFRMPSLDILRKFLDKKLPVCIVVNSAALFEKDIDLEMGHYIVLTGYTKDKFYYNDPEDGKSKSISANKLMFALSNNIFNSSAYLLIIRK